MPKDPLGIDWDAPTAVPLPRNLRLAISHGQAVAPQPGLQPYPTFNEADFTPKREPDALVLVIRRMTCQSCGQVSEACEDKLFLRTKGHFTPTLQAESIFTHLSRETKVLHLPAPRCGKCF
jgi:hypothetical protein